MIKRRVPLAFVVFAGLMGAVAPALSSPGLQGQPGQAGAPRPTTAVLVGQVVDVATGDPVPEAVVTLSGRPAAGRGRGPIPLSGNILDVIASRGGGADRALVDAEGRFVFRDLPPSTYSVRAEATGYLQSAGALASAGLGGGPTMVEVTADQPVARVTVRLAKEAVLSGVVVDEASEPLIRARVTAYLRRVSRLGQASFQSSGTATTDDRGEYRIAGLPPGDYLVAVPQRHDTTLAAGADALLAGLMSGEMPIAELAEMSAGGPAPMDPRAVRVGDWRLSSQNVQSPPVGEDGVIHAYQTVYFPAAVTARAAEIVTLRSGEQRGGVNFAIEPVATGRIEGQVTSPSGEVGQVPIRVVLDEDGLLGAASLPEIGSARTAPDGRFTLLAVPPGRYRVIAERAGRALPDMDELPEELAANPMVSMMLEMQRGRASAAMYGETPVSLGGNDHAEVVIAASEGVEVTGRLRVEGGDPASPLDRMRLQLRALGSTRARMLNGRVDAEGAFVISGVLPGRYLVTPGVAGAGGPYLVRDVTADGRDATTTAIEVGTGPVDLVVTVTGEVGTLRGTVRRPPAAPGRAPGESVPESLLAVVVPANYAAITDVEVLADRARFSPVGDDGTFRVGPLLTGEYLVAVIDESQVDLAAGIAALRTLAADATRVTVNAGDATSVALDVAGGGR